MELGFEIQGLDKLLKSLEQLRRPSATNRVLKAALSGGLTAIGKQMKKDLSPRVKLGRAAVKTKIKAKGGKVTAKVGFGVGRKKNLTPKQMAVSSAAAAGRGKRGGVGITAQNVHWWIAGTRHRYAGVNYRTKKLTGGAIISRGIMPAMQKGLAFNALQKTKSKIHAEMEKRAGKALAKEIARQNK